MDSWSVTEVKERERAGEVVGKEEDDETGGRLSTKVGVERDALSDRQPYAFIPQQRSINPPGNKRPLWPQSFLPFARSIPQGDPPEKVLEGWYPGAGAQ